MSLYRAEDEITAYCIYRRHLHTITLTHPLDSNKVRHLYSFTVWCLVDVSIYTFNGTAVERIQLTNVKSNARFIEFTPLILQSVKEIVQ